PCPRAGHVPAVPRAIRRASTANITPRSTARQVQRMPSRPPGNSGRTTVPEAMLYCARFSDRSAFPTGSHESEESRSEESDRRGSMADVIAVVGAGTMGHGIAHVAAAAGFPVILNDINREMVDKGLKTIDLEMQRAVAKGRLTVDQKTAALARITGT